MASTAGLPEGLESANAEEQESRTYVTLGTILLIILVIIIALLFWQTCTTAEDDGVSAGGGGIIVDVDGMQPVESGIAVWVKEGVRIEEVLERNDLQDAQAVDMGDGTFVISVSDDPEACVERLKDDPGLEDAGFLFTQNE